MRASKTYIESQPHYSKYVQDWKIINTFNNIYPNPFFPISFFKMGGSGLPSSAHIIRSVAHRYDFYVPWNPGLDILIIPCGKNTTPPPFPVLSGQPDGRKTSRGGKRVNRFIFLQTIEPKKISNLFCCSFGKVLRWGPDSCRLGQCLSTYGIRIRFRITASTRIRISVNVQANYGLGYLDSFGSISH